MIARASGPRASLALAAVLFSTGGVAIKATQFGSWQVACLRNAIAAVVLWIAWPAARRGWTHRTWLVSVAYAACLVAFVTATKLTTSANAIFLQSTAPLYIVLASPLVLRERIGRRDLVVAVLIAVGLAAFFVGSESPVHTAPNPDLGNAIAVVSGVALACMLMGLRWIGSPGRGMADSATVIVAGNLVGAVATLPLAVPLSAIAASDLLVVLYLGVVQIGIAYSLVTRGLRAVPAFEASLILLLEPALNPVWTWLLLGERPSPLALGGGAVILVATALKTYWSAGTVARQVDALD